jgi:hypothetical protein
MLNPTFSFRLRRSSSYSSCSRFNLSSSSSCLRCCFFRRRRSSSSSANAIASSSRLFVLLLCLDFDLCDSDFYRNKKQQHIFQMISNNQYISMP